MKRSLIKKAGTIKKITLKVWSLRHKTLPINIRIHKRRERLLQAKR
jgi:hypothetical protein